MNAKRLLYEAGEKPWSHRRFDASIHAFNFTPSNNTKLTIMDGQPRDHIVQVPDWFMTLRYVQIGLAAVVLALSAFGLSAIIALGGASYAIFVVSRDS